MLTPLGCYWLSISVLGEGQRKAPNPPYHTATPPTHKISICPHSTVGCPAHGYTECATKEPGMHKKVTTRPRDTKIFPSTQAGGITHHIHKTGQGMVTVLKILAPL